MHIDFVEIRNFRKLLATRIDLAPEKTIFVGANNSGKTSAMLAFRKFLSQSASAFKLQDLTLSHIDILEKIGQTWENYDPNSGAPAPTNISDWIAILPSLDLWLSVQDGEFHHVSAIMPNLSWEGGQLGVRLQLEPADIDALFLDFRKAREDAKELLAAAIEKAKQKILEDGTPFVEPKIPAWPRDLPDYLDRQLPKKCKLVAYPLDPKKIEPPTSTSAKPQELNRSARPLKDDPLKYLIRYTLLRGYSFDLIRPISALGSKTILKLPLSNWKKPKLPESAQTQKYMLTLHAQFYQRESDLRSSIIFQNLYIALRAKIRAETPLTIVKF